MATIIETVEVDGETINIYESGAQYNVTRKMLIYPASNTLITAENATALNRKRQELARAELVAGANEAVEHLKPDVLPIAGDMAYIRAIGYATTQKALTPKDPKQTDAARLMLNIGAQLGESKQPETINNTVNMLVLSDEQAEALVQLRERLQASLDAESAISASNNMRIDAQSDGSPTDPEPGA